MSDQPAPSDRCVWPAQVWPALAADRQTRIVWLLTPLAFNLVMAQAACHAQEVHHAALSSRHP
jgi:hypothetical protein